MAGRDQFLQTLLARILALRGATGLRIAINGVDGSGKTRLADELARLLAARGAPVVRASIDDFLNPRAVRRARGETSGEGYFRDSLNLALFRSHVLDPLGPGGNRIYCARGFDLHADAPAPGEPQLAAPDAVLLADGVFLLCDDLRKVWDLSIFLDTPFATAYARMAVRDGRDPDPDAPGNRRYRDGQLIYFAECRPQERADILVDYADLDNPVILRG